jgi:probable HAF family extracellular repeat protein
MREFTRIPKLTILALLCCGGALWFGALLRAHSAQYFLTDIGVLPGGSTSAAIAVNSSGAAVGRSDFHAVLYVDGVLRDLGTLGGTQFSHSQANGINDAGVIVGESSDGKGVLRAFVYEDGAMTDLGAPESFFSRARAINSQGQIVGEWGPSNGQQPAHAFLYENGAFSDLPPLGGADRSQANGINSHGQIVGFSSTAGGAPEPPPGRAVMWENGAPIDLGTFNGFSTAAWAINDSGQIVGAYSPVVDGTVTTRAFTYDLGAGVFHELPTPEGASSFALGINSAGDVVGYVNVGDALRAALWRGGVLFDLNNLIPAGSEWVLNQAWDINDAGQIVGSGHSPAGLRGFVLTPSGGSSWTSHDIGSTGLTGSAALGGDGVITVRGAGTDIWDEADSFHFLHQPLSGNGSIVARVDSITDTHVFAKAGVMMRDGLSAGAAHVILNIKPDGGVEFMQRSAANQSTTFLNGGNAPPPHWLRLVRSGSTITGSVSADGISWTDIGATTVSMPETLEVGLAVTSHDPSQLNIATFRGVSVMPAPWTNRDIGSVGLIGNASFNGECLSVRGAGADIWDEVDSFHYVYRPMPADGEITARVVGIENTHMFAKAGVMIRDGTAANAAHVILDVKPDGEVEFMQRATTGGSTVYMAGSIGPWIRLVRSGTTITAYTSTDGSAWTLVGSTTASFSSEAIVGVAVTSHDPARLASAVLDNVIVQ